MYTFANAFEDAFAEGDYDIWLTNFKY
jgi:hypothetical protein